MPGVIAAVDATAAEWLLQPTVDWWDLVRYGPPGFDAYVRIPFEPEPSPEKGFDTIEAALLILAECTTTPRSGYAAIWEGWVSSAAAPSAPRLRIPQRTMLLFTGPVDALRSAPELAWYGRTGHLGQAPHLVWPQDQAWCLACEVDEEIEFTVGCSEQAFRKLTGALPVALRRVHYAEPAPMYRDEP